MAPETIGRMRGCPGRLCRIKREEGLGPNTREQQPGDGGVPSMEHLCPTPASFPGGCDGWMDHLGARGSLCLVVFALLVLLCGGSKTSGGEARESGEGLAAHSSPRQRRTQECYFVTWWGIM